MSDFFVGGAATSGGAYAGGGVNLEALERTSKRMSMLQTYAPEFVTASPATALTLAEGGYGDDEMLKSATEAVSFANVDRLRRDLDEESDQVANALWASLPTTIQEALRSGGYTPRQERPKGGGRWGLNLPDFLPGPNELTIARSTPVLGPLGNIQAGLGEGMEALGDVGGGVLDAFAWLGEETMHVYRAGMVMDKPEGFQSPSKTWHDFHAAWNQTGKEDFYIRPEQQNRARRLLSEDPEMMRLARGVAQGKDPEELVTAAGFEPGSMEAGQLIMRLTQAQSDPNFVKAVRELSTGQLSFGRVVAQGMGLDDTDAGWGRLLSGTLDAGFGLATDPTLAAGAVTKGLRFGRWAFTVDDARRARGGVQLADVALQAHHLRAGTRAPALAARVGPTDMRRGRAVLRWADRVSEGFATGDLAQLQRDLPGVSTALDTMANAHVRRSADGLTGLDDTAGVLEWLKDRDGILALAGTRLGGASPMVEGIRLPTLTAGQRAALSTKKAWTQALDWSRMQYGPGLGKVVSELGNPPDLVRSLGQWTLARTAGDTGRFLTALTTHAPYKGHLPLFGDEAVSEFTRLVNSGAFTGMSRSTMDDYISTFAKGGPVVRSTQVEQFLRRLFEDSGIADTDFAKRFVGRHHQTYATGGGDAQMIDTLATRGAQLIDSQHADAMAIPDLRDFLKATRSVNTTRFLFHNTPASWADAALGKAWKPSVLMRIGFIPRAAGEELLHYALKHGPRTWLGAKGADWAVQESQRFDFEAVLREAVDIGDTDEINRLQSAIAGTTSALAPLRGLMVASDRMWMRAWDGVLDRLNVPAESSAWRRRLVSKTHALDERGVVSGLERFANQLSLRGSGLLGWAAGKTRIPTKGEIGEFLADRWNPDAAFAARLFVDDPTVARAFAEQISGSTMVPQEFRGLVDETGIPVRKVQVTELAAGRPVMREVELRSMPGEYKTLKRGVEQDPTFMDSLYARHKALTSDRVGSKIVGDVLPRWTGGSVGQLPARLGYEDASTLRADLNAAWAHEGGEELGGKTLLGVVREFVDGEDFDDARKGWLAKQLTRLFRDSGTSLDGKAVLKTLDEMDGPARHWLLYENVNPDFLTDDFERLLRSMRHSARARIARPDMYKHLRESRLYNYGDEPLAVPTAQGISKVYVPVSIDDAGPLGDEFVESAVAHIKRIGGYGDEHARAIARNVAASSGIEELSLVESAQRPISAWGASDPRVAEAVMAAVEETTGIRPVFGILEVPDGALQRSAGRMPLGLRTTAPDWKVADDFAIEAWRLNRVRATPHARRLTQLEVDDDWWDEVELDVARRAFGTTRPGTRRLYSTNRRIWDEEPPEGRFWFVDVPGDVASSAPLDVIESYGPHRLPAGAHEEGWEPFVVGHQFSEGLPEISAIDRAADGAINEALDILTTYKRDLDDDVLHELVEPLLRGNKVYADEAGNKVIEPGYNFNHLIFGTSVDRLPWESYGPVQVTARDSTWSKFVSEWFSGPVDHAISSIIRKPMFLDNFGKQLKINRGVADLFVDPEVHAAAARAARRIGLDRDGLDAVVLGSNHARVEEVLADMVEGDIDAADLGAIVDFVGQRRHGLQLARDNALNRAMQLTIPFIDDHRIRSQMQQYVGNFVPFMFAEEQFLKRWSRSIAESPEMIRKAQLMMNGLRSMGTVRKDANGNEIFVYPGAGEAATVLSSLAAPIFGENLRVPYAVTMTGQVGYTLPGIGDQVGVPSVGPLVAMPLEFLSRHFPEVQDVEQRLVGRGADQPLWRYFAPSGGAKLFDAMFGDIDSGQLASATSQAMLMMAVNGQAPPEGATPAEKQEFIEKARGQARFILATRAVFGMNAPAAPQVKFRSDELNDEFNSLLAAAPIEDAVQAFLASHPDIDATDLLAATVPVTEQTFGGLDLPTDRAASWMEDNADLIGGFPAAASWLIPQADADDKFSFRAWTQQFALGLRRRKAPDELLDDVYFQAASRDYFDERTQHEARLLTAVGPQRTAELDAWQHWKDAYFSQHPVFQDMLADPTRIQRRAQAVEELGILSGTGAVPEPMAELIRRYDDYRQSTASMRGDRRNVVENRRKELTQEFSTWALWHIERHPNLSGLYMRLIEPDLMELDEDAVAAGALS